MIEINDLEYVYTVGCDVDILFGITRATIVCTDTGEFDLLRDAFDSHSLVSILGQPFRIVSMHRSNSQMRLELVTVGPAPKVKPETMSYEDWLKWSADELGRAAKRRG